MPNVNESHTNAALAATPPVRWLAPGRRPRLAKDDVRFNWPWMLLGVGTLALGACAGLKDPIARGNLVSGFDTPKTVSMTTSGLRDKLIAFEEGKWILNVAGAPTCGVDVYRYQYNTVDGQGKRTTASSALMVPTGTAPPCSGPRPMVVGLHGTVTDRSYNLADLSGTNSASPRAIAFAATYAAQGYVVVAPNYAGFDTSALSYHPYLDAEQQSKDVIDAIVSARSLLQKVGVTASDKLFLTGYSQGGFVAMATHRAMQESGMHVTASMPSSGGYPLTAITDDIFSGRPVQGSTTYLPLAITAFQKAFGTVYSDPSEIYNPRYATGIESRLPSTTPLATLVAQGNLPATAVFSSTAPAPPAVANPAVATILANGTPARGPAPFTGTYAEGFGAEPLLNNTFRLNYLQDMLAFPDGAAPAYTSGATPKGTRNSFRRAIVKNDLRGWTPKTPIVMCGGRDDLAVPFRLAAQLMQRYWTAPATAAPPAMTSVLDIDSDPAPDDPYAPLKRNFATLRAQVAASSGEQGMLALYHSVLLPRYCYTAARQFFDTKK